MGKASTEKKIAGSIRKVLADGKELVRIFLDESDYFGTGFAGRTFDDLAPNPSDEWTATDLVAVSLLDVRVRPSGVRALLGARKRDFDSLLRQVNRQVALWDDSDDFEDVLHSAESLQRELRELPGLGRVTASKLMARKRPRLIPIDDRVIRQGLGLQIDAPFWRPMRSVLRDDGMLDAIRAIRPEGHSGISELRVLDIALWMAGSNSRAAKEARRSARKKR
jgi:hypothetical protein